MARRAAGQEESIALGSTAGTAAQNAGQVERAVARMKDYLPPAVHDRLARLVAAQSVQVRAAHEAIGEQVFGQKFELTAEQMFELTTRPITASSELMQALEAELVAGLDRHLAEKRMELIVNLAVAACGVLLVVYLLAGMYLGLRRGIDAALQGGRQLAEGNLAGAWRWIRRTRCWTSATPSTAWPIPCAASSAPSRTASAR